MTKDQKQVLKAIGVFIGFKIVLYVGIHLAAKAIRQAADDYATR
jgi:hypothetical protein